MQPVKMLEAQADLTDRLHRNKQFIEFCVQMMSQIFGVEDGLAEIHRNGPQAKKILDLASLMVKSAQKARCYHVSADMTALIQHAADKLDEDDVVRFREQAPHPYGLVRFDGTGLKMTDPAGANLHLDWILWGEVAFVTKEDVPNAVPRDDPRICYDGFGMWEFNDRIDNPDEVARENTFKGGAKWGEIVGRWELMGSSVIPDKKTDLGPPMMMPVGPLADRMRAFGNEPRPATNTLRLLVAFWLLLQQPVTEIGSQRLTGPARKAAKARAGKRATGDVTVIDVRRRPSEAKMSPAPGRRNVEWAGRWYVNGFWRWQACGPGRKDRRRIWVDGFIKGPDDKPLIARKHIYSVKP